MSRVFAIRPAVLVWRCKQRTQREGLGGRARRYVLVPPNLDGFTTVHKIVGREVD